MTFPHEIFKAYDIRGVVETALTPDVVYAIGQALGTEARDRGADTFVVGRDGRLTGPSIVDTLGRGICSTGCDVIDVGMVPTPALYMATVEFGTGTGVQVTGSHNPPEYNGLKMMIDGHTLSGEAIQDLKGRILEETFAAGSGDREDREILDVYKRRMLEDISLARPLKVAIDCGNGVAGVAAAEIFRGIGCEVIELFCEVDGTFPNHHPDPSRPENLVDLIEAVKTHDAELGLAFDGDGDRLGVVTPTGQVIWPDRQMLLFARDVLKRQPGAEIIYDVKCTQTLPAGIRAAGGTATMCQTGHSFMKAKLKETGAPLAGEMSGHIFFNDRWGGFDDGIYAGARLCELLAAADSSPSEVFSSLPDTVNTPEIQLRMAEGEHYALVDELVANARFDDAAVSTIDGIRVDFDDGFGLIRASNTTPVVVMRFEAENADRLEAIQARFRDLLRATRPSLELPF